MLAGAVDEPHNCTCRANGRDYAQGQVACIRGKLAQCSMNLNNSSWKIISETCPEVLLRVPPAYASPLPQSLPPQLPSC
jgi:hypothetical protein